METHSMAVHFFNSAAYHADRESFDAICISFHELSGRA